MPSVLHRKTGANRGYGRPRREIHEEVRGQGGAGLQAQEKTSRRRGGEGGPLGARSSVWPKRRWRRKKRSEKKPGKKRAEERAARQAAQAEKEESPEAEAVAVAESASPDPEPNDAEAVAAVDDASPDASPAPQPTEESTEAVHPVIYEKLKEIAKSGKTEYYTPIGKLADLDMKNPDHRRKIGQILDAISRHEHKAGRPLLSVVVVAKATEKMPNKRPSKGFFDLARKLGLIQAGDDEHSFFDEELKKVHTAWR